MSPPPVQAPPPPVVAAMGPADDLSTQATLYLPLAAPTDDLSTSC